MALVRRSAQMPSRWFRLSLHPLLLSLPLRPLSESKRTKWLSKMAGSRPRPAGWKLCFLNFFFHGSRRFIGCCGTFSANMPSSHPRCCMPSRSTCPRQRACGAPSKCLKSIKRSSHSKAFVCQDTLACRGCAQIRQSCLRTWAICGCRCPVPGPHHNLPPRWRVFLQILNLFNVIGGPPTKCGFVAGTV